LSYAAAYGGSESVSAKRSLRRDEDHPLGIRRHYEPADDSVEEVGHVNKKWTFGVAAGALLVAGTFAAGALGLGSDALPTANQSGAPEHAPTAPGHSPEDPGDIGTPAVAAPPHGKGVDRGDSKAAASRHAAAARQAANSGVGASSQQGASGGTGSAGGTSGGTGATGGSGGSPAAPATPAPAPAPQPARQQGTVEKVVKPVTDTVGHVLKPVTDTVGGLLSPVTGTSSGGGDQPAMTMINPLGDLLGS
jgi:hypothetical protein